jgi:hypothetical protein
MRGAFFQGNCIGRHDPSARPAVARSMGADGSSCSRSTASTRLLWRDTHAPRDLFGALPEITVRSANGPRSARASPPTCARSAAKSASPKSIASCCPMAAPTRTAARPERARRRSGALLRLPPDRRADARGHRRGLGIIIVSDTYLDEEQLRGLIAAPPAGSRRPDRPRVLLLHLRQGQGDGLYELVLKELNVAPHEILHIGDNKAPTSAASLRSACTRCT